MKYCSNCGLHVKRSIPPGDDRPRFVCEACSTVYYENPKVVVGAIPEWEGKILLCRRAIEPCHGKWTLPAGYLENGETLSEGAKREALEEANARIKQLTPYTLFNLTFVNQVYFIFRSILTDLDYMPGHESLEVRLFKEEEMPWDKLAFSAVRESLMLFFKDRAAGAFRFHMGDILPAGLIQATKAY